MILFEDIYRSKRSLYGAQRNTGMLRYEICIPYCAALHTGYDTGNPNPLRLMFHVRG